nr:cell wall hydrolase [Altericroceibacterium endophyticum]
MAAAPQGWSAATGMAEEQPAAPQPMPFEQPGMSFPGSAFYYLDDIPPEPFPGEDAIHSDAENPTAAADFETARPFKLAGTARDQVRAQQCLAMAVYYEAGAEAEAGQRAVAQVVLNRVRHAAYPNTVCGVVFQGSERSTGCQFSFTCDGSMRRQPARFWFNRASSIARQALNGATYAPVGLSTHYHTTDIHPYWASSLQSMSTIGAHRFYRWRGVAGYAAAFGDVYVGGEPAAASHKASYKAPPAPDPAVPPAAAVLQTAAITDSTDQVPAHDTGPDLSGTAASSSSLLPQSSAVKPQYRNSGRWIAKP